MARPDKVYVRFRGKVAANLTGVWGDTVPDLICVDINASGLLVASAAGLAKGVIMTTEGKASPDVANYNVALAGDIYTVFVAAEFVSNAWASPTLTAGEQIWSSAAGDVVDSVPANPAQKIGWMAASDEGDPRLILNVTQIGDVA